MTRSYDRRAGALVGLLVAGMAVLASAGPASAQTATTRFESDCQSATGAQPVTNGFVDVPAGTIVNGVAVTTQTGVRVPATVVYPNGSTGLINQVSTVGNTTTRTAIQITGGPGAGTVIGVATCAPTAATATALRGSAITATCPPTGQAGGTVKNGPFVVVGDPAGAQCTVLPGYAADKAAGEYSIAGVAYLLPVDVARASGASPDLAPVLPASSEGSGPSTAAMMIAGVVGLALVAQVAVARKTKLRRATVTTG